MNNARKLPTGRRLQYGALPYRKMNGHRAEFMLVTSRETRRWIIPKGWPKKGKSPHRSAAREAFEEAGVLGAVGRRPLGSFSYEKRLKNGSSVECKVRVFPLEVSSQRKEWPERQERRVKALGLESRRKGQGPGAGQDHPTRGAQIRLSFRRPREGQQNRIEGTKRRGSKLLKLRNSSGIIPYHIQQAANANVRPRDIADHKVRLPGECHVD